MTKLTWVKSNIWNHKYVLNNTFDDNILKEVACRQFKYNPEFFWNIMEIGDVIQIGV